MTRRRPSAATAVSARLEPQKKRCVPRQVNRNSPKFKHNSKTRTDDERDTLKREKYEWR